MTSGIVIYHNPHCSKSRETLYLIEDKGIKANTVFYMETPPTVPELQKILIQLGFDSARQLMRTKEAIYQEMNLDNPDLSEQQLLEAMTKNPRLLERPIVICNNKARLGRPPENILDILIQD